MNYKDPQNMGCVRPKGDLGNPMDPQDISRCYRSFDESQPIALSPTMVGSPWARHFGQAMAAVPDYHGKFWPAPSVSQSVQKNAAREGQTGDSIIVLLSMEHV